MMFIKKDALLLYSSLNDIDIDGYKLQSELSPRLKKITEVLESIGKLEEGIELSVDNNSYKTHLFNLNDFQDKLKDFNSI